MPPPPAPTSSTSSSTSPPRRHTHHNHRQADTTFTKVFVGGLAWETTSESLQKYFEQFGDIIEAVVICDRISGRSRGYGFVTYENSESATAATANASPIIDNRKTNCVMASKGAKRRHSGFRGFRGPVHTYYDYYPAASAPWSSYPVSPPILDYSYLVPMMSPNPATAPQYCYPGSYIGPGPAPGGIAAAPRQAPYTSMAMSSPDMTTNIVSERNGDEHDVEENGHESSQAASTYEEEH